MKDIKTFLIGFLSCTCLFLFMGATDGVESMDWNVTGKVIVEDVEGNLVVSASDNGKYQAFGYMDRGHSYNYIIDTHTGQMWNHEVIDKETTGGEYDLDFWNELISPNDFWNNEYQTEIEKK